MPIGCYSREGHSSQAWNPQGPRASSMYMILPLGPRVYPYTALLTKTLYTCILRGPGYQAIIQVTLRRGSI